MQLIFGFIILFILAVIFSSFQGFIDFLVHLGIFPEKYLNNGTFDVMMIFVLYVLFMTIAFIVGWTVILFGSFLDLRLRKQQKRAKKRSLKEYGTDALYFYYIDPKIHDAAMNVDKLNYVYRTIQTYLLNKYEDWDKVDQIIADLSNIEQLKLYYEAVDYFGYPDIPKEYGIFFSYTDEDLVLAK
jgi:hypothetical protein